MKRIIAVIVLSLAQISVWGGLVSAQERGPRAVSSRNRTQPRLVGARGGQPMHTASHIQVHSSESVVEDEVVGESVVGHQIPETIVEGEHLISGHDSGCNCGGQGCDSCSVGGDYGYCDSCHARNRFCICFPSHGWVHADYLLWYQSGMNVPPLVSTSTSNTRATAGVLGVAGTSVLYGGSNNILDDERSGGRIRFGWWLDRFPGLGIEGEYLGLAQGTETFFQQSTGTPILARPFFNVLTGAQDSELVAFPNVLTGNIGTEATTELNGAAFRFRRQACCSTGCGYSEFCCQTVPISSRLDGTLGYRYWELKESLQVRERLTTGAPSVGAFSIDDRFQTRNQFNGAELGFLWQGRRGWWTLDALMRVGVGNVHQTVTISGNSAVNNNGTTTNFNTGFLAQRSNIGTFERNEFTMVPEFGLTAGYQMTRRLRATLGYSLIYWGNVVRPGDQIDTDVNPNLLAPEVTPFTGVLRPQFQFQETDYWVQGLNFGGEFRW